SRTICADECDWYHCADALVRLRRIAPVRRLACSVTARAMFLVDLRALRSKRGIHGIRIWRRLRGFQIFRHAQDAVNVKVWRERPRSERSGKIALIHRGIVAVPMELHSLARLLVPDGRKVNVPHQLLGIGVLHGEIEQCFWSVEGVYAARPPG